MKHLLFVALGGALGAMGRYGVANLMARHMAGHFPWGTLAVNLIGSFFIGVIYVLIVEKMILHPDWRSVIIVGFLGAFTTFSTFSLEIVNLLQNGQGLIASGYVASSVVLCALVAWAGIALTRLV
jgi:CrcB protein